MTKQASRKQTGVMAIGAVVLLLAAIGYRMADEAQQEAGLVKAAVDAGKAEHIDGRSDDANKIAIRAPDKGYIATSIDNLARDIVSHAPNQAEAFGFLVEAKSLRIQNLRARRAKEQAVEARALYDVDLWSKKRGQIETGGHPIKSRYLMGYVTNYVKDRSN